MTSTLTGQVNAFHRPLLRMALTTSIRAITKHTDWSDKIYERRFRYGVVICWACQKTPLQELRALAEAEAGPDEAEPGKTQNQLEAS